MLKMTGYCGMAVCISSLGLFGTVVYMMEKRLKRSVSGKCWSRRAMLMYLLSKGVLVTCWFAAAIALPLTWLIVRQNDIEEF